MASDPTKTNQSPLLPRCAQLEAIVPTEGETTGLLPTLSSLDIRHTARDALIM